MSSRTPTSRRWWLPVEMLALSLGLLVFFLLVVDVAGSRAESNRLQGASRVALDLVTSGRSRAQVLDGCVVMTEEQVSTATRHLMCEVKYRVRHHDVRVRVTSGAPDEAIVCTMMAQRSITGVLGSWRQGRANTAVVHIRVDRMPPAASEQPLEGLDWSFCPSGGGESAHS